MEVILDGQALRAEQVVAVARQGARLVPGPGMAETMRASAEVVAEALGGDRIVYGVTTGFGALASRRIRPQERLPLQAALVRSHAAGIGAPVEAEVVRAMMALRACSLSRGYSGVRPVVVETLCAALEAGVVPWVPEHGSLGASGDLAPLAHVALALMGEGWALGRGGGREPAGDALAAAGIRPLVLGPKEGLALLNGTDGMLAHLVLALDDAAALARAADVVAGMTLEALLGTDAVLDPRLHALRPHPGQLAAAANLRKLVAGSAIVASHRQSAHLVQDAYSLRCCPQVHGASRDALAWCAEVAGRELSSVIDNPVVLPGGEVMSTGNFHGQPLAFAADLARLAVAELGAIAERRVDRLLDAARSNELPPFLARSPGRNSGFMLAHYTAAALAARHRRLAAPASADSLPTSAGQEDHVSMGWSACRDLRVVLAGVHAILAVEALCAAAALELRGLAPGQGSAAALRRLRAAVPRMDEDRFMAADLEAARDLVAAGELARAAERAVGPLD
ncbi:MAG TPA: histidine ammonia-lyase [Actinomycetes bacterium]|nr:histidine ammonia-lyase [Actinomycetes bacterium]